MLGGTLLAVISNTVLFWMGMRPFRAGKRQDIAVYNPDTDYSAPLQGKNGQAKRGRPE